MEDQEHFDDAEEDLAVVGKIGYDVEETNKQSIPNFQAPKMVEHSVPLTMNIIINVNIGTTEPTATTVVTESNVLNKISGLYNNRIR